MTVMQLLFAERDGEDVVLDGVLVADPRSPGVPPNMPTTLRLRLPDDPQWRTRLAELLQLWAHTSRIVRVELRPSATKTVAEVACQRSKVRLDVVEMVA